MDDSLPDIDVPYALSLAFMLGATAAMHTFGLPSTDSDKAKVVDTLGEIAAGDLTLLDTGAESRLKGLDIPPEVERHAHGGEKLVALIIWDQWHPREGSDHDSQTNRRG